jgi:predicted HAD superfamily Cof-like phosphohydrolase
MKSSAATIAVREFHKTFDIPKAHPSDVQSAEFRMRLIHEEFNEVIDAAGFFIVQADTRTLFHTKLKGCDTEHLLKELADLAYVIYGTAEAFGWDLDEAVKRVHESNMTKLGADGKPVYREDGKVMKGPGYKEPYLGDLV